VEEKSHFHGEKKNVSKVREVTLLIQYN